jgi:hypothetical protein
MGFPLSKRGIKGDLASRTSEKVSFMNDSEAKRRSRMLMTGRGLSTQKDIEAGD